uniref:Fungal lipase-type domain-containing protein n=1 Tax=Dunaliella tertiolecta TaxID=3047 RepID=A0A7S3VTA6_DUNTE|mmetsp:Transcript_13065/g.35584  ORF Transcript_13065/g.35584 Transcript_13065/m.35584 type:complete len:402 (+) Transcript_13065:68-1273(+)
MKPLLFFVAALLTFIHPVAESARLPGSRNSGHSPQEAVRVKAHDDNTDNRGDKQGESQIKDLSGLWHQRTDQDLPPDLPEAASRIKSRTQRDDGLQLDDTATVFTQEAVASLQLQKIEAPPTQEAPLDINRAKLMARLTSAAYCSDKEVIAAWTCTRCKRVPHFKPFQVIFDEKWDLMSYIGYLADLDAIVVVFRGTDSGNWGNWLNDMKSWRQDKQFPLPEAPHAFVHAGFLSLWTDSSLQSNITAAAAALRRQHNTPRLFVTGHSMGAAISSLCALDLKFKLGFTDVRQWTFGSPRVGDQAWQQTFNQVITESWRFTHNRDIVPSLPLEIMGFRHLAREAWIVDVETPFGSLDSKILVCDSSGEDPSCHNSACFLGWCTSVSDHLLYLGIEMYKSPMEC